MTEPVSGLAVTAGAAALATAGWWSGLDVGVVLGAFAGAVFFVVASTELTRTARAGFFLVSFVFGVLAASMAADILSKAIPTDSRAPEALGALFAAAVSIKLLLGLSTKDMIGRIFSGLGNVLAGFVSSVAVRKKEADKDE